MRYVRLITCVIVGFFIGATSALAEEIENEQQFLEQIAGRKLVDEDSWVIISPNGTVHGEGPKNGTIAGDWTWNGKYYCRDIVIDEVPLPHDCQMVSKEGNTVVFTHNEGEGISVIWAIE